MIRQFIPIARKLIAKCNKESPDLSIVEAICRVGFAQIERPPEFIRPLYADTDEASPNTTKATFIAFHWIHDRMGCSILDEENEYLIFLENEDYRILYFLMRTLQSLHKVQLAKDPRYLCTLRNERRRILDENTKRLNS